MEIIAITHPYFFPGEAAAIEELLRSGRARRVHIRKPGGEEEALRALIEAIAPELRPALSLHDHLHLAPQLGLGGVHLNSRFPTPPPGWQGLVSRSIHSLSEIASLSGDYAFLSPIFPSISKPGYSAEWNRSELTAALRRSPVPVYALGGVTPDRLPALEAMGFGGAAMLGAAWRAEVPADAFSLQFITHPTARYDVVEGAREALEGGCRWVQLRSKDATREELIEAGHAIAALCRSYGAVFLVDDHVDLVHPLGAHGVHLGKNDMPVAEARRQLGPAKIIGATANCFADIAAAAAAGADYIGLGPYRFTTTKKNLSPVLGVEGYRRVLGECGAAGITLPVVAIGGITDADLPAIFSTGVSGVALSGTILNAPDPAEQTARTLAAIAAARTLNR